MHCTLTVGVWLKCNRNLQSRYLKPLNTWMYKLVEIKFNVRNGIEFQYHPIVVNCKVHFGLIATLMKNCRLGLKALDTLI